jgi:hypothetical protein
MDQHVILVVAFELLLIEGVEIQGVACGSSFLVISVITIETKGVFLVKAAVVHFSILFFPSFIGNLLFQLKNL